MGQDALFASFAAVIEPRKHACTTEPSRISSLSGSLSSQSPPSELALPCRLDCRQRTLHAESLNGTSSDSFQGEETELPKCVRSPWRMRKIKNKKTSYRRAPLPYDVQGNVDKVGDWISVSELLGNKRCNRAGYNLEGKVSEQLQPGRHVGAVDWCALRCSVPRLPDGLIRCGCSVFPLRTHGPGPICSRWVKRIPQNGPFVRFSFLGPCGVLACMTKVSQPSRSPLLRIDTVVAGLSNQRFHDVDESLWEITCLPQVGT